MRVAVPLLCTLELLAACTDSEHRTRSLDRPAAIGGSSLTAPNPSASEVGIGGSLATTTGGSGMPNGNAGTTDIGGSASAVAGSGGATATASAGGGTTAAGSAATGGASTSSGGVGGTGAGGNPATPPDFTHTFESVDIGPGEEILGTCQSWTLGNDAPIYVNKVVETNGGEWHHSNWIWVPDNLFTGPDGTWKCADRGFDQIAAGALGGVFFAQSTEARADTQGFPDGVAFMMPAHARIIGDAHLFNASDAPASTSLHFDVYSLPQEKVRIPLQPMAFTNVSLDIAPMTETRARMQCATPQPDFDVYYVLPHFHSLGQGLTIDVAGGPMDGQSIFQSMGTLGNSLGRTFDPPIAVKGSTGLAVTCDYRNPGATSVKYGEGNQEMCVVLLYTTGKKAGGETLGNVTTTDTNGVHRTDALCLAVGI
jgi:hypothetical protein